MNDMKFAEIVRSAPQVRETFSDAGAVDFWWRLILALHGKPVSKKIEEAETRLILVRGFRLYAYLYATVAVAMLLAAGTAWTSGLSNFWALLLAGASIYLVTSSKLAFVGSRNYLDRVGRGRVQLVTFFVSIIAFLSCFCGACAVAADFTLSGHGSFIFVGLATFLTLGVGSYTIEIVFLVSGATITEAN
ncbi:MAG: hypothetical protein AAF394_01810 [Planctomycetota bacterium]